MAVSTTDRADWWSPKPERIGVPVADMAVLGCLGTFLTDVPRVDNRFLGCFANITRPILFMKLEPVAKAFDYHNGLRSLATVRS